MIPKEALYYWELREMRYIESKENVKAFLIKVKQCIDNNSWTINNNPWANGIVNKTNLFMAEKNLSDIDVISVVKELSLVNYSYTDYDINPNFPNETFWFFGIKKYIVDTKENLYIKLKVREFDEDYLLIMSFHREEPSSAEK